MRVLAYPAKPAVRGVEDDAVRAYGPTVEFVRSETNSTDRVALRQRILPLPFAIRSLRPGVRNQKHLHQHDDEKCVN